MVAALDILSVTHGYRTGRTDLTVLDDVSLSARPGEFVALLGPSGSGKSTLLRLIAGLELPLVGSVFVDGEPVRGPHPSRALMFQDPTLLPWRTVRQNVELGPDARHSADPEGVSAALDRVGLADFADALPARLSGGMAQRAALARALVGAPSLLLLDEPLGKLDALTRSLLQSELESVWQHNGFTTILVTHDVDEALRLAQRIVVFGPRPARVIAEFDNPLPRPRVFDHPDFLALRRRVIDALSLTTTEAS
ncbi:ABC transporter ATP-binding protein [Tsukamurella asaccharolytica]|uniref:ABC transporter ATP-binding protein n=1 Tax=Tsukamurella asaccharolytica TaxID=2592067 RepID=A0A5C5RAU9_9ACTN|nr:ABC transporter ATP-binding protein [Tsukamurella asaccharolytica]TWS19812.1 ABC transporter ATP-binding protein [Tsukamurella asaccharolytica]